MANEFTERLVNALPGLDKAAEKMQQLYEPFLGPNAPRMLKDGLYGVWTGHPLHPAIVDMPIGFWTSTLVFDVVGMEEAADLSLKIGTVTAVAAAATGAAQWQDTQALETPRRVGALHAMLNSVGAGLYGLSWLARSRENRPVGIALSTAGFGLTMFSAWLGGELAYDLGIGVNRTAFDAPADEWTEVAQESDLAENTPKRVEASGIPLLLVKQNGAIYAMTATCTHVGGPLDEGEIDAAACTVTCPWHGSVYDLRDAKIIHGPGTGNGQSYETRIQAGAVSVRPKTS